VAASGGVRMAAITKINNIAYYLGKEKNHNGQFEDKPESKEQFYGKRKVLFDGGKGFYVFVGESEKKFEAKREYHEIAEKGTAYEQYGGEEDKWNDVFFLPLIEAGRDKEPEFIKDEWSG
jgi:hypothetical protein